MPGFPVLGSDASEGQEMPRHSACRHGSRRRGSASTCVLVLIPVMLAALLLAANAALFVDAHTALQDGSDAAALAGAQAFVHDDHLRGDAGSLHCLLAAARDEATLVAKQNAVLREGLDLQRNDGNRPDGDILLGTLDRSRGGTFTPLDPDEARPEVPRSINAARIPA